MSDLYLWSLRSIRSRLKSIDDNVLEWFWALLGISKVLWYFFWLYNSLVDYSNNKLFYIVNTTVTFIDQNGDTGVSRFWPLEMAINMFQKHQKKFGTPRCGGKTGSGSLSFDPFRLLITAKMAMFEVIPRASWRSNSGSEPLFTSELTQILKIWSQKFFFPLGSLEDGHVPERRILPQFQNKAL